jgi:hypothetical protein
MELALSRCWPKLILSSLNKLGYVAAYLLKGARVDGPGLPRLSQWASTVQAPTRPLLSASKSSTTPSLLNINHRAEMRLINTETLHFEEFDRDIPPYAILSHRWEEEEVAFADYLAQLAVLASGGTRKKGFGKIELCVKQARFDGLSYCWVDTCCIDKSSSAELTEAINSMYAWYRDSAVCYIYLSDVDVSGEDRCRSKGKRPIFPLDSVLQPFADDHILQLASSQWFTRGWTLQELLAPAICIFYDLGWVPLLRLVKHTARMEGGRYGVGPQPRWLLEDEVEEAIEEATGIDATVMTDFSPTSRDFSVARKMSWASKRKTTRAEDMAYCLMGIFDVNMPLLYGEGGVKAFRRLQEEIIKQTDDHSIFYWRDADADRSALRGLLAKSPVEFSDSDFEWYPFGSGYIGPNRDAHPTSTHDKTFGMTNRGLRISLATISSGNEWEGRVIPGDEEEIAILECGVPPWRKCCILLARLSDGDYARVDPHILPCAYYPPSLGHAKSVVKDIFVRQDPVVHHGYMSSRRTVVKIRSDAAFEITSTCPEHALDANKGQIRPSANRHIAHRPAGVGDLTSLMWHNPDPSNSGYEKEYFNNKKPLVTAVVHVVDLFPPGVPGIDFTISVQWKSRREGHEGPYEINVQFDQVHYTGMATQPCSQQQTGWKVSPKSIVWTSSSGILRIGVREQTLLDEGRLVLGVCFTWERKSAISGRVDPSRSYVSPSRSPAT